MSSGKSKRKKEVSKDVDGGDPTSDVKPTDKRVRIDFGDMPPVAGGRGATFTIKQNRPDPSEDSKRRKPQP